MNIFFIFVISFLSLGGPISKNVDKAAVVAAHVNQEQEKMTTYYFIRHSEKDERDPQNKDPFLTEAGLERAAKWSRLFQEVEFDLIFSSDYDRTRKTAEVIAAGQEKEVEVYDARNLNSEEFQKKTKGKTVLVVGHSNTNPAFVNSVLKENKYKPLEESEYGSLFVLNVAPDGTKSSQVLYIN